MSLQSLLHREGWRQQTMTTFAFLASAQTLCRNCLSRRLAITTRHIVVPVRTIRTMSTKNHINHSTSNTISKRPFISRAQIYPIQAPVDESSTTTTSSDVDVPELIQQLRTHLYDPPISLHNNQNQLKSKYNRTSRLPERVNNTIIRRIRRIHVMRLYREIRQNNYLLGTLTQQDIETMILLFLSPSSNTTTSIPGSPFFPGNMNKGDSRQLNKIATEILYDLSKHHPTLFNRRHAEMLVCLYASLGETTQAEKTMQGLIYSINNNDQRAPSVDAFDALVYSLVVKGDMEGVMAWIKNMEKNGVTPTPRTIRSMVDGYLRRGDQDKALEVLKTHGVGVFNSIHNAIEQGKDDLKILEIGLKQLGHEAIDDWLLKDARRFYNYCQERGMGTTSLVRHLVDKSLYTFQSSHVYDLLADTKANKDEKGTEFIGRKLLNHYLARGNITNAFRLWSKLSGAGIAPDSWISLYMALAQANRHEQLMRLYRFMKKRYPELISVDLYNAGLRTFVRSRSYANALTLYNDMIKINEIPPESMPNDLFYSLYGLCARTGDTKLFRNVLDLAAEAGMEMDNKALTSLMACYIQANDFVAAKQVFGAIAESHGPDVVDFNLLIRATAKESQDQDTVDFNKILKILQHMGKVQAEPNASTYRTLLDIYREGQIERQLFERLSMDPSTQKFDQVFLNNIALTRIVEREGPQVAFYKFMKNERSILFPGTPDGVSIYADSMTYKILLDALTQQPRYMSLANKLYKSMRAKGWFPYREVYEQMILGWARKGRIQRARQLIQDMKEDLDIEPTVQIYTMLIDGLLVQNKFDGAIQVIEEMKSLGLYGDQVLLERIERFEQDNYNEILSSTVDNNNNNNITPPI
ncbi:hypothetical protein INT45_006482 [Circinella minor]|uniref:Pentacotripeptide-repeat region of PRORP domain-containing protein n=1 Tax=Circinella minor TaxID=1195481 RepID=A0A8H7RZU6_9FUNG|nr:hypothetical protein INT45_006482 [Circinella minor]